MKLALNLAVSLAMLALCVRLMWPDAATRRGIEEAFGALYFDDFAPYLFGYLGLLVVMHVCRALRWNSLLAPLGVHVPAGPLLAISSVGFMAILALPARLGEFVRPGLLRQRGGVSASAALGTVAVERIVDGLLISLLVFVACFALRGPHAPSWMMPMAYGVLAVFVIALGFLVAARRRPAATVKFCLALTLLPRIAPRIAAILEKKLVEMIRGFDVLHSRRHLATFLAWTIVYWGVNGLCVYVLARGFGLPLSVMGGMATMGICAVGLTLPNPPAALGQFQWFTLLGLSLYLGTDARTEGSALYATTYAFAMLHYCLQVAWYLAMGALGLATPWVSFHDLWAARKS